MRLATRLLAVAVPVLLAGACTGKYVRRTTDQPVAATPERLARGRYLVESVAACGSCHTTRDSGKLGDPERPGRLLAGGNVLETLVPRMRVSVPNVTSDADTGVGRWTDDQLARAIRDGVDDRGDLLLPVMPWASYHGMSDADVEAVVAFLRSVPRLRNDRPEVKEVPPAVKVALEDLGVGHLRPAHDVKAPPPAERLRYGEYLAGVATCADCHSLGTQGPRKRADRFMAGSDVPFGESGGEVWAPNLTPDRETGLGRATPEQVVRAIRTGVRLDGKRMAQPMADLATHYAGMTEEDLGAIVAWLFTLPPVKHAVPAPRAAGAQGGAR